MKKLLVSLFFLTLCVFSFAQNGDYKKPQTIGVSFFLNDFTTGAEIKSSGFGYAVRSRDIFKTAHMNAGMAFNYMKGLTNHLDLTASLGGSFVRYPVPNQTISPQDNFLLEGTVGINLKLLNDNYWVVPFVSAGVGVSDYQKTYAAFAPLGAGIEINVFHDAYVIINSQYRAPVTDKAAPYLFHSITFAAPLGKKK